MKSIYSQGNLATQTLVFSACMALAQPAAASADLFDLSIEELVSLEVTSVSRKPESLADASSAVYVITRADIERHGVRSIPDALRLAPGLSVAQIDANKWSIGSRGFSGRFTNKLLVLMDGRQLYTPSFSGVYWDAQHTLIEEVERIEVIRGPGAVVWGTNAVNGVINIITAKAGSETGGEIMTGLDPEGASFAGMRYHDAFTENTSYRVFAHYTDHDGYKLVAGGDADDQWSMMRGSFRTDYEGRRGNTLAFTLEGYSGDMGSTRHIVQDAPPFVSSAPAEASIGGAFAMLQWSAPASETSATSAQAYLEFTDREDLAFESDRQTVSVEIQHQRKAGRHDLSLGGSLRSTSYDFTGTEKLSFFGEIDDNLVVSAYLQDEVSIVDDRLSAVVGLKLESNNQSPESVEWMPTLRLLWKPSPDHTFWAAATRAVRSPSIAELNVQVLDFYDPVPPLSPGNPLPLPLRTGTQANPDFESEIALSYEIGLRGSWGESVSYDLTMFSVDFDKLRSIQVLPVVCYPSNVDVATNPACLFSSTAVLGLGRFNNDDTGHSHGGEAVLDWQARSDLRIRSSISITNAHRESSNPADLDQPISYPSRQANLRAEWSPADRISVSAWVRYVDEIEFLGGDDYWQGNLHARWEMNDHWTFSTGVRNLIEDENFEGRSDINDVELTAIERRFFVNVRYDF